MVPPGQETSFEARLANRFRFVSTSGSARGGAVAPFTVTCMTGEELTSGTTTLICDEETYCNWAGVPPSVTVTPATEGSVPSGAATPVEGPRFVPNNEIT